MTEEWQGPTPGVCFNEVFVKRELTVFLFKRVEKGPGPLREEEHVSDAMPH